MVKKHSTRSITKKSGRQGGGGITNAVMEAAVEIGHAAESFKDSMTHVQKARQKGKRAVEPIRRAGKKAIHAVRRRMP
ncbi:MAG TPA: hypothetical protein VG102_01860 [Candidatus Paceibacterota bacterium]|nr:hypothetical protein [Candidatus Paceibacterota bacterium]